MATQKAERIPFKCAVIQMNSVAEVQSNLDRSRTLITSATEQGAQLIVLPETFACIGASDAKQLDVAEKIGHGRIQDFISELAQQFGVWIIAGSIPTVPADAHSDNKVLATSILFDNNGKQQAVYHKIHLFDVELPNGADSYHESRMFTAGNKPVVVETPFAKIGMAICYDLRFPELFRLMSERGAEIVSLPSAFTAVTGAAHWEVLMRARAIENQTWLLGAGQNGTHANSKKTYGHSMIVDPWGTITQRLESQNEAVAVATIDLGEQTYLRNSFPCLNHRVV